MPQVVSRLGADAMAEIAIDEWMGASPIYTKRVQRLLGFEGGDDVETIFKGMQFDIGAPPQFMDFRYRVADEHHGEFWLDHCGALMDVEPMGDDFVVAMCHTIEDPTFPATATATNSRAVMAPIHRPPRSPADRHPHCHWTTTIDGEAPEAKTPGPASRIMQTVAAGLPIATIDDTGDTSGTAGRIAYAGPLQPVGPIASFSAGTLRALAEEIALQGHLLALSGATAIAERAGDETAASVAGAGLAGVGGVVSQRLRATFETDDGLAGIAAVLALHPAFHPRSYIDLEIERDSSRDVLSVSVADCPALSDQTPPSWARILADDPALMAAIVWGADPTAACRPVGVGDLPSWEIMIDGYERPEPEAVTLTSFSTAADFRFEYPNAASLREADIQ